MPVVVPITLILIMLVGIGTEISGLAGMTVSEAFDSIRSNHNYSISDEQFNDIYSEYHDNPLFSNQVISKQDLNKILAESVAVQYNIAVQASGDALEFILGGFDSDWVADLTSREVRVYDDDGVLKGSTRIYGVVDGQIQYSSKVSNPPDINKNYTYLCFATTDSSGYTYYHTDIGGILNNGTNNGSGGINTSYFSDSNTRFSFSNEYAGNVFFTSSPFENYFKIFGTDQAVNSYVLQCNWVSPISGKNDLETDVSYIGTATTSDGSEVGVRPDGSIVMPDGSVVYPSTATGLYPDDVTGVRLDDDFWARVAELIGQNTKTGDTSADGALTNLNLEGLRSIASSMLEYLKGGFWTDLKDNIVDVFEVDTSSFKWSDFEKYDITGRFLKWLDNMWYGVTGVHLVQSEGG